MYDTLIQRRYIAHRAQGTKCTDHYGKCPHPNLVKHSIHKISLQLMNFNRVQYLYTTFPTALEHFKKINKYPTPVDTLAACRRKAHNLQHHLMYRKEQKDMAKFPHSNPAKTDNTDCTPHLHTCHFKHIESLVHNHASMPQNWCIGSICCPQLLKIHKSHHQSSDFLFTSIAHLKL